MQVTVVYKIMLLRNIPENTLHTGDEKVKTANAQHLVQGRPWNNKK